MSTTAVDVVLNPSFDGEFKRWFGDGGAWLAGNPRTCEELSNLEHFWIGNSETCACGEMVWKGSVPRKATT